MEFSACCAVCRNPVVNRHLGGRGRDRLEIGRRGTPTKEPFLTSACSAGSMLRRMWSKCARASRLGRNRKRGRVNSQLFASRRSTASRRLGPRRDVPGRGGRGHLCRSPTAAGSRRGRSTSTLGQPRIPPDRQRRLRVEPPPPVLRPQSQSRGRSHVLIGPSHPRRNRRRRTSIRRSGPIGASPRRDAAPA